MEHGLARFSFMGAPDGPLGQVVRYDVATHTLTVERRSTRAARGVLDYCERELARLRADAPDLPFDFTCGFAGYLGYELKADCGGDLVHRSQLPDAALVFCDRLIAFDHDQRRVHLVALADESGVAAADAWLEAAERELEGLRAPAPVTPPAPGALRFAARDGRDAYLANIAACKHEIGEGETYEVCLTTELHSDGAVDPLAAYRALRARNPAPHAALLRLGDVSVLSSSPERFLRVGRDRVVESKPIKGTAPRAAHPAEDAYRAEALRADEKSRAENLMIVDLVRNDLGRVCALGSVEVPALMVIESYATVHQLVTTVRGRLRDDASAIDCIRAAFPGGSMTGAPKLRTMEILDRLESGPRGVYSGALGFLSVNGTADLSIVIRTLVASPHGLQIGSGGAIVAASDPAAEHDEMLLKARAVLEAVGGTLAARPELARQMTELLAADSWLVVDGRARAVERHWARFSAACASTASTRRRRSAPRSSARCPPRAAGSRASSCARTASSRSTCARRRRASRPWWPGSPTSPIRAAPRGARAPTSSGSPPCATARRAHGAGEAVLADADGRLLEGAYTSLLWWEGETLCAVPDDAPILPGITRALLIELAGTVELRRPAPQRPRRPRDLAGQRAPRHPRRDALGGRSRARRGPARGHMAAPARKSRCNQRWLIADERHRSPMRTATSAEIGCGRPFTGIRSRSGPKVGEPPETPVR